MQTAPHYSLPSIRPLSFFYCSSQNRLRGLDGHGEFSRRLAMEMHKRDAPRRTSSFDDLIHQLGNDIYGEAEGDFSGRSIVMSADGKRVAIGAYGNDGTDLYSGHVRVHEWNEVAGESKRVGEDIDGEAAYNNSGFSIAMSADGKRVAIGAYGNGGAGVNSGHVRVYDWNEEDKWEKDRRRN
jgi:hypothetical protein